MAYKNIYNFLRSRTVKWPRSSVLLIFEGIVNYNILCELSLLFNKKEGVEEKFPKVVGNSHYENLWNHLDKRELRDFRSTKNFNLEKNEMKVYIWITEKMTRHFLLISTFSENFKFCWSSEILSWVVLSGVSHKNYNFFFKMTTYML